MSIMTATERGATRRNLYQNLFFACIYNSVGIPIAAAVRYPALGILLSRSSRNEFQFGVHRWGTHADSIEQKLERVWSRM